MVMKLDAWLSQRGIPFSHFAADIGVNPVTLWRIRKGKTFPEERTVRAIGKATKGKVRASDLLEGFHEKMGRGKD